MKKFNLNDYFSKKEEKYLLDDLSTSIYKIINKYANLLSVLVALLCLLMVFKRRLGLIYAYTPEVGGLEHIIIYIIQRTLHGFNLYSKPDLSPYFVNTYAPLYYQITVFVGKLMHVNPSEPIEAFRLSRTVAFCCNIILVISSFITARKVFNINVVLSLISSVFVFVFIDECGFSRFDSLYVMNFSITILFFLLYLKNKENRLNPYLFLTSIFSVLTVFSKQSGIYLIILILVFIIFYLKDIKVLLVSIISIICTSIILLFTLCGNDLHAFYLNIVKGLNQGIDIHWFLGNIIGDWQRISLSFLVGFFILTYWILNNNDIIKKFLVVALIASFFFPLFFGLKPGARNNYFNEFINLTILSAFVFITTDVKSTIYNKFIILLFVIFILFPVSFKIFWFKFNTAWDESQHGPTLYLKEYKEARSLTDYFYKDLALKQNEYIFITDEETRWLDNFFYRNNFLMEKEMYTLYMKTGKFDLKELKNNINTGMIKYIITPIKKPKMSFNNIELTNYSHLKDTENYSVYKYNK